VQRFAKPTRAFYRAMSAQRASQSRPRPMCESHAHHIPPDSDYCAAHVPPAGERRKTGAHSCAQSQSPIARMRGVARAAPRASPPAHDFRIAAVAGPAVSAAQTAQRQRMRNAPRRSAARFSPAHAFRRHASFRATNPRASARCARRSAAIRKAEARLLRRHESAALQSRPRPRASYSAGYRLLLGVRAARGRAVKNRRPLERARVGGQVLSSAPPAHLRKKTHSN